MHFTKLKFQHFRNFEEEFEIVFQTGHTIVLGANGIGKSSIPLGLAFVLAADNKFLRIERERDFINQVHISDARDTATCTVTLTLEGDDGREVVLQRTVNLRSESAYQVDGINVTDVEYRQRLRDLHLQAAAVVVPQRFVGGPESTQQYGFGKYLESFCDFFNEINFSEADQQALKAGRAKASQLERRITSCQKTIDQITSLQYVQTYFPEDYEQRIKDGEQLLMLADLWKLDERKKRLLVKLAELMALDVEPRRIEAEQEITIIQNEMTVTKAKLEELQSNEATSQSLELEVQTRAQLVARLASTKNRLRDLMVKVRDSTRGAQNPRTELMDKLLREMVQFENSNIIGAWLRGRMMEFDVRFREEHPEDFQALGSVEDALATSFETRKALYKSLKKHKNNRDLARKQKKFLEENVQQLKRTRSQLERKLDIQKSILKRYDTASNDIQALIDRKRKRLNVLRRHRSSSIQRSTSVEQSDFELRCLIENMREIFEEQGSAVYGLLEDLIQPKEPMYKPSFRRVLRSRLKAIVVNDRDTQTSVKKLLVGDEQYQPPRTQVLVMPKSVSKKKFTIPRLKRGVIPLTSKLVVSEPHSHNERLADRLMQMIEDLTGDIVFCDNDALAMKMSSTKMHGPPGQTAYLRAVTADGTLCSGPGKVTFPSSRKVKELPTQDSYKKPEDILKEMQALESYIQRKPGVAHLLYRSLKLKLEFSIESITKHLNAIDKQLEEAASNIRAERFSINNSDEACRHVRAEIEALRNGEKSSELRTRRAQLLLVKVGYITDAVTQLGLRDADVLDALKLDESENIKEADYLLEELIGAHEEEMEVQWQERLQQSMEESCGVRIQDLDAREETAIKAKEEAEQTLTRYRDDIRERIGEKETLVEKLTQFTEQLSELFSTTEQLSREAASNAMKEKRLVLRIKKLKRTRRDLYLKLNQGASQDAQDGDEFGLEDEQIFDPGPVVDFAALPEDAKVSEEAMANFTKTTRDGLSDLRCKRLTRASRASNITLPPDNTLEAKLAEKRETLAELQQGLQAVRDEIHPLEQRKLDCDQSRNTLLKRLYDKLPGILSDLSAFLTGRRLVMNVKRRPSGNCYINSEVTIGVDAADLQHSDHAVLPVDERVGLWLSIIFAVQEIFGVPSLVLDEIDARTNLQTSKSMHERLHQYAVMKQVVCITHTPSAVLDKGLRFIGLYRCPLTSTRMMVTFDESAVFEEEAEQEPPFPETLTGDEINYITAS